MIDSQIKSLKDLQNLRSAPTLDEAQSKALLEELYEYMNEADWFTVGVMAPSTKLAIFILKAMESHFHWPPMNIASKPNTDGPVFLKGNQKTRDVHIRIEYGLGEGVLISCQHENQELEADTLGPFPLDFFPNKSS